jgi:CHAT domain
MAAAEQKPYYLEFRVEVQDLSTVKVTRTSGSKLYPDGKVFWNQLAEDTISVFDNQLAQGRARGRDELRVIGGHLFRTLFDDAVARAFLDDLAEVERRRSQGDPVIMRLKLEFQPQADRLASLPWEYLYAPEPDGTPGHYIAADEQLVLTRFVPMAKVAGSRTTEKIRVLAVVSTPERGPDPSSRDDPPPEVTLGEVKYQEVLDQINGLQTENPERFEVKVLDVPPTQRSLTKKIKDFQPHLLHFIGHGSYDWNQTGMLALVRDDDPKVALWVDDMTFAECLGGQPPLLVFLQSCQGAHSDSYRRFRGMALKLVGVKVGAVVAMQYEIENSVATAFAQKFYQALAAGEAVDQAVQTGRWELSQSTNPGRGFSSRAFGSPVVFGQTADGIVIVADEKKDDEPSLEPADVLASLTASSLCPWPDCHRHALFGGENFCPECHQGVARCPRCAEWVRDPRKPSALPFGRPSVSLAATSAAVATSPGRVATAGFFCYLCGYTPSSQGRLA